MRIALFPAVAVAALAFTGVAQADTVISLTLNGTVTGGIDSEGLFGAQYADLTGDAVTLFLSYDVDSLNLAATNHTAGISYVMSPGSNEYYYDYANENAVTESVAIGAHTVPMSNDSASSPMTVFLQ